MDKYIKLLSIEYILLLLPQVICSTIFNASKLMPMYIICYLLSCILLLFYFFRNKVSSRKKELKYIIIYFVILLFTLISDFVLGISVAQNDLFDMVIKLVNMALLMCFIPKGETNASDFKPLLTTIFVVGLISCIYNLFTNYNLLMSFLSITNSYQVSFSSFFANRNTYGTFLFVSIIAGYFLYKNNNKDKKVLLGITLLLLNLVLTMSRGALLTTGIFFFLHYYYSANQNKGKIILYGILGIVILLCLSIIIKNNSTLTNFIMKNFVRADVGTSGRTDLWIKGLKIAFSNNFMNGVGFYTGIGMTNGDIQFHSFFVDTIVDSGILGLLFKLYILFKSYLYIKKYSKIANNNDIMIFYKSALFALIFLCVFESVNFFALGFTEMEFTLLFITIPWVLGIKTEERNVKKDY